MSENTNRPVDRIRQLADWLIANEVLKSMYAFEKICNLSKHYVKNLSATEKGNCGIDTVANIYEVFPSVNLEWLVCGKGKMFKLKGDDTEIADSIRKNLIFRMI